MAGDETVAAGAVGQVKLFCQCGDGGFGIAMGLQQGCKIAAPAEQAGQQLGEARVVEPRSEEHTSELQSLMRISYAVFCLKKNKEHKLQRQSNQNNTYTHHEQPHTQKNKTQQTRIT